MTNKILEEISEADLPCVALVNTSKDYVKSSYEIKEIREAYRYKITGNPCVGKEIDDSGEGPYPMYYTIYKPLLDTDTVNMCPLVCSSAREVGKLIIVWKELSARREKENLARTIIETKRQLRKLEEKAGEAQ